MRETRRVNAEVNLPMHPKQFSFAELALLRTRRLRDIVSIENGNSASLLKGNYTMKKFALDFTALFVMLVVTAVIVSFQYVPYFL